MFQDAGVITEWLVEGLLDLQKVDHALSRLVMKWPMLAGRLQRNSSVQAFVLSFCSRNLLLPRRIHRRNSISKSKSLPATYVPYSLTSSNYDKPITDYVQLPLPMASEVLPATLFMDHTAPQTLRHWVDKDILASHVLQSQGVTRMLWFFYHRCSKMRLYKEEGRIRVRT